MVNICMGNTDLTSVSGTGIEAVYRTNNAGVTDTVLWSRVYTGLPSRGTFWRAYRIYRSVGYRAWYGKSTSWTHRCNRVRSVGYFTEKIPPALLSFLVRTLPSIMRKEGSFLWRCWGNGGSNPSSALSVTITPVTRWPSALSVTITPVTRWPRIISPFLY